MQAAMEMHAERPLVDFADDCWQWTVINDGVMGGVSQSSIETTDRGTGLFSGTLSLENNGGFASIRTLIEPNALADRAGLELRVRGDGRSYELRLRADQRMDGIAYRAGFDTRAGEWTTIRLRFEDFTPTYRGRFVPNAPILAAAEIRQIGFLLADQRPGAFELEIEFVRALSSASVLPVTAVDLDRYAGLWYEVAKIPNRFQKQCAYGTTAQYTLREDGTIRVVNRCFEEDGTLDAADGVARIVDERSNAQLEVSFVSFLGWRPFWGDYWVIGLDDAYQWAVVGTPDRKYGWILARTPELPESSLEQAFEVLDRNGYDRDAFEF